MIMEKVLTNDKPRVSPQTQYETRRIRDLLQASFSDEDLTVFCFDHFRPVHNSFTVGMTLGQKVQLLIEYCDRHNSLNELDSRVQEFVNSLRLEPPQPRVIDKGGRSKLSDKPDNPPRSKPPIENPYYHGSPIRSPEAFFGRRAEVKAILDSLKRKQSVSLVGPRRIGKTSTLNYISHPDVMAEHHLPVDRNVMVMINFQGLAHQTPAELLSLLLEETAHKLAEIGQPELLDQASLQSPDFVQFRQAVKRIEKAGLRLVFLMDEFELLIENNSNLDRDFFGGLRNLGESFEVTFVTATPTPLHELSLRQGSVLGSPFFNIFRQQTLGLMPPGEARQLLTEPSQGLFSEADVDFLLGLAGPYPFFLQIAAYHLFNLRNAGAGEGVAQLADFSDQEIYGLVRDLFADEASGHFQFIWQHLTKAEENAIAAILQGGLLSKKQQDALRLLDRHCLVYENQIFSQAFAEFSREQLGS